MSPLVQKSLPYIAAFVSAFVATYLLVPPVREMNRRLGMVDKPGKRRVNKMPVPRGGGIALAVGILSTFAIGHFVTKDFSFGSGANGASFFKVATLSLGISLLGYADDKFSLKPKAKLAGQLFFASLVWLWADLGFGNVIPWIPPVCDFALTVFWVAGAVNAFNLIDGLDGLASGIALIATLGMAGTLFIINAPSAAMFHFAIAGGLVAFLRYNYNPASVFLGDSGSMFLGFLLSTVPLATQTPRSFLVSVGVPVLAMGVPIFDTALAILRRVIRRAINRREHEIAASGEVMTADVDHIHHRILRSVGLNQRKATAVLYAFSVFLVVCGIAAVALESRAAGFWIVAFSVAAVVIFKDMARVELFDAGRLLNAAARDRTVLSRRRIARLAVPILVAADICALIAVFFFCAWALRIDIGRNMLRIALPARVASVFMFLVLLRAYRTVWSRAMLSNFIRLAAACFLGTVAGTALIYYSPVHYFQLKAETLAFAPLAFTAVVFVRIFRSAVRDLFYAIDCSRLTASGNAKRILVYGCGLRYRAFRRELVRSASSNDRVIVGLLDDDILMRGHYIGGIQVLGTINQAREIVREHGIQGVVIACEIPPEWMKVVVGILRPAGVEITHFKISESPVDI